MLLVQCWALSTLTPEQTALTTWFHCSVPASSLQVSVPYSLYRGELGENKLLRLTAVLRDEDSSMYLAQEEISVSESPLSIEVSSVCAFVTAPATKQLSVLKQHRPLLGWVALLRLPFKAPRQQSGGGSVVPLVCSTLTPALPMCESQGTPRAPNSPVQSQKLQKETTAQDCS